jgi:hypothetical protein
VEAMQLISAIFPKSISKKSALKNPGVRARTLKKSSFNTGLKLVLLLVPINISCMKRFIALILPVVMLSSCDIDIIQPVYDSRDDLIGYYDVEEYSETYNDYTYYDLRISKSSYSNREVYIHNFYAVDIRVYATLDYDKLRIPYQVVNGYEVEGVGTVNGDEITFSYRIKDLNHNSYSDFCESIAVRD